jgi:hypothetical protein
MSATKSNCTNWSAVHDFMPPTPGRLKVRGECLFPTSGYKVLLKKRQPQGINPKILILDKTVTPPTGHVAQHPTTEHATYDDLTNEHFTEVLVQPDDIAIPVTEVH